MNRANSKMRCKELDKPRRKMAFKKSKVRYKDHKEEKEEEDIADIPIIVSRTAIVCVPGMLGGQVGYCLKNRDMF